MRQIKFRAWDGKQFHFFGVTDVVGSTIPTIAFNGTNVLLYPLEGDHPIEVFDVQQYTSLNDINGKEIYEGDIVRLNNEKEWKDKDSGHMEGVGIIKFTFPEYVAVKISDKDVHMPINWGGTESIIVIGNIYENPNLCSK